MSSSNLPVSLPPSSRFLSTADFHRPADVLLVIEWFANIDNPQTKRVRWSRRQVTNLQPFNLSAVLKENMHARNHDCYT